MWALMQLSDISILTLPAPSPRSGLGKRWSALTSGMKLLSHTGRFLVSHSWPLPEKLSVLASKRFVKENGQLYMKSASRKRFINGGAEVTANRRAGLSPDPLKC